jgi:putative OPT family oligopeptide transporter
MADALNAPQATLISTIARGVLNANLDWATIGIGAGIGVVLVILDEVLGALKLMRLPPLAVGIGIYLPMSATVPVTLGSIIGWFYNRAADKRPNAEMAKRFGVLLASGLIVGESMLGVFNAAVVAATNKPAPFAVAWFGTIPGLADILGLVTFVALTIFIYQWVARQAKPVST